MNKVVVLLIKVLAILPFLLPSPSSLLKFPNVSLSPLNKVLWKHRSLRAFSFGNSLYRREECISVKCVFSFLFLPGIWYSPSQPFLDEGALRDIPKTAARETRDLAAVCIFGHVLKDDWRIHSSLLLKHVYPGSDKTVLQSSASSSQLRSREIFLYASQLLAG